EGPQGCDLTRTSAGRPAGSVRTVPAMATADRLYHLQTRVAVHRLTGKESVRVRADPSAPEGAEARRGAVAPRSAQDIREEVPRPSRRARRHRPLDSGCARALPPVPSLPRLPGIAGVRPFVAKTPRIVFVEMEADCRFVT